MIGSRVRSRKYMPPGRILRVSTRSTPSASAGTASDPLENGAMLDIIMLAIGLGFFALLVLYGIASEKL